MFRGSTRIPSRPLLRRLQLRRSSAGASGSGAAWLAQRQHLQAWRLLPPQLALSRLRQRLRVLEVSWAEALQALARWWW